MPRHWGGEHYILEHPVSQSPDYVFAGTWCPLLFGFPTPLADYSLRGMNMEANQT